MRSIVLGLALAVFLCAPVVAAGLSSARCEHDVIRNYIKTYMKDFRMQDGSSVERFLGNNSNLVATTVSAQKDRLICKVGIKFVVAGSSKTVRGTFIYREFPGHEMAHISFIPN